MKTQHLLQLPTDAVIHQLKIESNPKFQITSDVKCDSRASEDVKDDWGDSCGGYQCMRENGHQGRHMTSDGANGWVYW